MKDLSFYLLKNSLGLRMKKSLRTFCNDNGSTSTLDQKKTDQDHHHFMSLDSVGKNHQVRPTGSSTTLEEMILQLELEEAAARKAKLDDYGDARRRMSCVNNSDVLRSARNALNQYPRFSLDGRDAMYRSSFGPAIVGGYEPRRKSVCCSGGYRGRGNGDGSDFDFERNLRLLPQHLAGESVVWCKPGVVAKLMGLDAMPLPIPRRNNGNRGKLGSMIRKENLKRAERQEMEKRRVGLMGGVNGCRRIGRDICSGISGSTASCSSTGYRVMKPVPVEPPMKARSRQTRRKV